MKLVDILARELKAWPAGGVALVQGSFGQVYIAGGGPIIIETERSSDWELAEVTREEWRAAVDAQNAAPQNDESQNVARIEWDGEGLPPTGTICEVEHPFEHGHWSECKILAWDAECAVFSAAGEYPYQYDGQGLGCFRPVRTPDQIAAAEREKARDYALNTMTGEGWTDGETEEQWQFRLKIVSEMLDMGYRKP